MIFGSFIKFLHLYNLVWLFDFQIFVFNSAKPTVRIDFTEKHFSQIVILHAVFFWVRDGVSYRDLEEIIAKRSVEIDHAPLDR